MFPIIRLIGVRRGLIALILLILAICLIFSGITGTLAQGTATPTMIVPAGSSWQGYILIEIAPVGPFVNGVTAPQKAKLHEAFTSMAREHDSWPPYILQDSRWRLDNLALIVEARFISMPTKAQAAQLISNRTGYTVAQINNALTVTVFAFGGSWAESRDTCAAYLAAHMAEWEPPNT